MTLHTENSILIHAPPDLVYGLAADVARWPDILPHYRWVRVLEEDGLARRVKMAARRSGLPVSWTSLQRFDPAGRRVLYHHVGGVTRGMDVVWRIEPHPEGSRVTILHDLDSPRLWLRHPLADYVVGTVFVHHIADRTLQGIKRAAEAQTGRRKTG